MAGDEIQGRPSWWRRIGRRTWLRSGALVAAGVVAGGVVAGTVVAHATPGDGGRGGGHGHAQGRDGDGSRGQRAGEELLTGDTADRVTEAALEEYPGATVERVETDSDGVYEAHLVTEDGDEVTVLIDEDFEVTGTETDGD